MCKTIKKCFLEKLTFDNMLSAHKRASKGKKTKKEVILFEMDLETNLIRIIDDIKNNKYEFGDYREFIVYEPKERIIKSLPYRDRIVHQWFVEEFIKPYYSKRFIKDTYACIDGRGTHLAVDTTQEYMRKMQKRYKEYYVLKCDIKKYFYNINKEILINILRKRISDELLLDFVKVILNDGADIGIPIGNFTSQYFANIYLNELDHYIKEVLQVKYYIRYMDDFVLLTKDKTEALFLLNKIENFLKVNLKLELNTKSKYFPSKFGIDFCGYRIYETHIILRKRFKKKISKNIKLWRKLKEEDKFLKDKCFRSWNSFKAHASHANSYNYISNLNNIINDEFIEYTKDFSEL